MLKAKDLQLKQDEYGTVLNSPSTYKYIAHILNEMGSILIAWTDQRGTQLDIMFTKFQVPMLQKVGPVQGGLLGNDLFVSIMRMGAFGFEIDHDNTFAGYYEEKLAMRISLGSTADELAKLINGVKKELLKNGKN